ncbi:hypothetical protein PLESTB_000764600 [Pleodorina starrii]|uniref:CCHC-type domain-containing protein n=1 Tax=Pleodorina starrii TaxID=330485 RepID=A0A9W6BKT0_9CHLO|nr:hypothetical protein PLESTB_000764600 [Pleodorina starrii]
MDIDLASDQLGSLVEEASKRLNALLEHKNVKAAKVQLVTDPGKILTGQLREAYAQYMDAVREHQQLLHLLTQRMLLEQRERVEPAPKRQRMVLPDYDCDFGASEGKGNKSLIGQRQRLVHLHDVFSDVQLKWRAVVDAPAANRAERAEAMEEAVRKTQEVFEQQAKELVIAHHHGWDVVGQMRGTPYAATEEEQKALKKAIKAAAESRKVAKPPGKAQPAQVAAAAGPSAPKAPKGPCYKCNAMGHWAKECPNPPK